MATSYANEGGTGDRTALITLTASSGLIAGTISTFVDGAFNDAIWMQVRSDAWLQFDFGSDASKIIDEIKWYQSGTQTHGTWKVQGSDDASSWDDLSEGFTLGGVATQTISFTNAVGYRYYRLLQTAGSTNDWAFEREIEFKIDDADTGTHYDDGTPDGGIVFGGQVVEVGVANAVDPTASGGIVFGGEEVSAVENHQNDGIGSGGIVFGGEGAEQWYNPWAVAVKGGTYRIAGVLYTLDEAMSYPGLGSIAALVLCGAPPATTGHFRYDLLSINAAGDITVTAGTEAATPVMPATPAGEIKLDHVLRYNGQAIINQSDIGKMWTAPALTSMVAIVTDDELAWGEASTAINVYFFDQYQVAYTGAKVITATITTGNGAVSPTTRSGSGASFAFTYTRGGSDPGDVSPVLTFSAPAGQFCTAFIKLLDAGGAIMI